MSIIDAIHCVEDVAPAMLILQRPPCNGSVYVMYIRLCWRETDIVLYSGELLLPALEGESTP